MVLLSVAPMLPGSTQSAHLSALESSVPAAVVEPTAGVFPVGLAALWADPTASPRSTGGLFGVFESSYASVRLYHYAVGFRLGPRWSLTFGSTEIRNLFDTSLTNQDPGLSSLRARALWTGLDATVAKGRLVANLGLALATDDNVGEVEGSTVGRAQLRLAPFGGDWLQLSLQHSRVMGGSIPSLPSGRQRAAIVLSRHSDAVSASFAAALSRGALWRYSETRGAYAAAVRVVVLARLAVGAGIGQYETTYGATRWEWLRSADAGLVAGKVRFSIRYTSTRLGFGSGFGASLGYEAGDGVR
ncbi:MAG: hypothetical protein ACREL9_09385 [Gemmatimonadales bacterium]